jgi:hypothetical protein|tara:strand:+ start:195 stop:386 length:192 start_codon:yes stop_codon:yes gene_type:complete
MYALGNMFGFGKTDEYVDFYVYRIGSGATRYAILRICRIVTQCDEQNAIRAGVHVEVKTDWAR